MTKSLAFKFFQLIYCFTQCIVSSKQKTLTLFQQLIILHIMFVAIEHFSSHFMQSKYDSFIHFITDIICLSRIFSKFHEVNLNRFYSTIYRKDRFFLYKTGLRRNFKINDFTKFHKKCIDLCPQSLLLLKILGKKSKIN